jgi:uncharacterized membrane protein (DUF485 family)
MGVLVLVAAFRNNWQLIPLYGAASFNIAIVLATVGNNTLAIIIAVVSLVATVALAFKLKQNKHSDAKIYFFVLALLICGSAINFIVKFFLTNPL